LYPDPAIQGACFSCGQKGYFAMDCLSKGKDQTLVIQEADVDADADADTELGKEEP
jgi:hypothetical protein